MRQSLALLIGLRYLRAKRRNHFISFITFFSAIGIALGVMILIVVLSVMNGFESEIRERTLGMASHGVLTSVSGVLDSEWQALAKAAKNHPKVVAAAPYVEKQAMLANGSNVRGVMIRGVLPEDEIKVADRIESASHGFIHHLMPGKFQILLGSELRRYLGLRIGQKVTLITPQASVTPAGILPRLKRFTVMGEFTVGMGEYDSGVAFIHMADAKKLFRLNQTVSGVRLKLDNVLDAPKLQKYFFQKKFKDVTRSYYYRDWTSQYANFYKALAMEKRMMFIILTLIIVVAAFNIVSTLVMVVTDKVTDIAILRTIGLSPGQVMGIFMVQGTVIGAIGTILGVMLGVILAINLQSIVLWIEKTFQVDFLQSDVYYISELPSDLNISDVMQISVVSFILTILATIYPAWRASRVQPAEALRYE